VCLYDATASDGSTLTTGQQACRTWAEGGKLGGGAKWKHTLGARYTKLLENDMYLTANLSARHVGDVRTDRADSEAGNADVRLFPAYTRVNASVGVERDAWGLQLWAENLADKRAIVSSQAGGIMGERIIYTQPRTIGMNLSYSFK
jgi:iron complex outermembrane recepter protein